MDRSEIKLREALISDVRIFFEWANDLTVRQNAFNEDSIMWSHHLPWFESKLKSKHSKLFVLIWRNIPAGQIRFDKEGKHWQIDYSIAKEYRGNGLGKRIVNLGIQSLLPFAKPKESILAKVKLENKASIKVFTDLGFKQRNLLDMIVFEYKPS